MIFLTIISCSFIVFQGLILSKALRDQKDADDDVTPQVSISCYVGRFILISDCTVKVSISGSRLSPFIKLLMKVSPNLELFDLKNSQIWSLLKTFIS
jgi:hypothetical protein